jgi:16S rRNA C1402 N4-methylase RsmH
MSESFEMLKEMDEEKLFELWADYGDEESPESVAKVIEDHGLRYFDSLSFMAYCAGFQKAASFFKEKV